MGNSGSASIDNKYSAKTTSVDIMKEFGTNSQGKYVVITGANCGLGLETARALAEYGADVTIACRNPKLGEEAIEKIKSKHPEAKVSLLPLDLSSLSSVDSFVEQFEARKQPLHILINNAGVMACPKTLTKDGFENQLGVNHLGHFYLTNKLLGVLKSSGTADQPARVINLASLANYLFPPPVGIRLDDLSGDKYYNQWERYGSSKLANIVFSNELNRRMKEQNAHVMSVALHPGVIAETNLMRHDNGLAYYTSMTSALWNSGNFSWQLLGSKSIEQGSATSLYCALSPDVVPGEYYSDCKLEKVIVHKKANDSELMRQLWEASVDLTKLNK